MHSGRSNELKPPDLPPTVRCPVRRVGATWHRNGICSSFVRGPGRVRDRGGVMAEESVLYTADHAVITNGTCPDAP